MPVVRGSLRKAWNQPGLARSGTSAESRRKTRIKGLDAALHLPLTMRNFTICVSPIHQYVASMATPRHAAAICLAAMAWGS